MNTDELLRTEFTSRTQAIAANKGQEFLTIAEITSPLQKVGGDLSGNRTVKYVMRRIVLKEFEFPWGNRWKFCLDDHY